MQKKNYVQEILDIIHSGLPQAELAEKLSDYHENDLADALTALTPEERQKVYTTLGVDTVAEIFSYLDDAEPYLKELDPERAARVISHMDSDDAVDALDDLEEDDKAKIVHQLDKDAADDVKLLLSYNEDEIGSCMTTNYICIRKDMTIRQAMSELVKQAGENDNISTLYVVDENEHFYGAIDLKDLIVARADDSLEKRVATVGRALPGVECKIINTETGETVGPGVVGEFCARGYNIMKGYYKMPEATAMAIDKDGWLHLGDLAVMDEDGYYKITGRIKDMIIRGGENIYPKELEDFMYTHPKVQDVQVIGVPSKQYGEEIMACIILKQGQEMTEEEVKDYFRAQMSRHKVPRYVRFMDSFPMTASGKIQKFVLREQAIELLNLQADASIETA